MGWLCSFLEIYKEFYMVTYKGCFVPWSLIDIVITVVFQNVFCLNIVFKMFFVLKCIEIIFFYFLKFIFEIKMIKKNTKIKLAWSKEKKK
jgi:hypothetical protein